MGSYPSGAEYLLGLSYSRSEEREADEGALERLKQAKVNAQGFKSFFGRKQGTSLPLEFLSTHPSDESRARLAEYYEGLPSFPVLTGQEWSHLQHICD